MQDGAIVEKVNRGSILSATLSGERCNADLRMAEANSASGRTAASSVKLQSLRESKLRLALHSFSDVGHETLNTNVQCSIYNTKVKAPSFGPIGPK